MLLVQAPSTRGVSPDEKIRAVRPHPEGGWKVVVGTEGRQVAKAPTKDAAIGRARQILSNAGGGQMVVYGRAGEQQSMRRIGARTKS